MARRSSILGLLGAVALASACSGGAGDAKSGGAQGGADGGLFFAAGIGTGGVPAATVGDGGPVGAGGVSSASGAAGTCAAAVNDAGCVGAEYTGETIPLDIYIMFDQSGSMLNVEQGGVTRLDAVREAVNEFVHDPKSAGMGVGIGYFGYEPIGQTTCNPADYTTPAVPVGTLPGNAQAIVDSLAGRTPTGETPSGAAIRGACDYGAQWMSGNPGHRVAILLVTDGNPEAPVTCSSGSGPCCPTLDDAVVAATDCRNRTPGLPTYVLGVGPLLDNLVQIAIAGGTDRAYLVDGGDVTRQVVAALNTIRTVATIPCELKIPSPPAGETILFDQVNLFYTIGTCDAHVIAYRDDPGRCDTAVGGWYFDDAAAPQKILLCGKTCADVAAPGTNLQFSVGCGRYTIH